MVKLMVEKQLYYTHQNQEVFLESLALEQAITSQQQQQKMVEKLGHTQNISKEMIYLMVKK